jgi:hypothetical protein
MSITAARPWRNFTAFPSVLASGERQASQPPEGFPHTTARSTDYKRAELKKCQQLNDRA